MFLETQKLKKLTPESRFISRIVCPLKLFNPHLNQKTHFSIVIFN